MTVRPPPPLALATALALALASPECLAQQPPRPAPSATARWLVPLLHGAGLLAAQRVGASLLWSEAFSLSDGQRARGHFAEAWTLPPVFNPRRRFWEWDGDWWVINAVGHGLMGSELYLRARQCGHGFVASALFTAGASAAWEYAVESWHARPSVQDLVWTPLGGALLGELRLSTWRLVGSAPRAVRAVVRAVVDPFGELERALGTPC